MRHFLCLFLVMGLATCENVKVKISKGTVKGTRVDHDFGQYFYSFRGIRYAKPPTEELRFMVIINYTVEATLKMITLGEVAK